MGITVPIGRFDPLIKKLLLAATASCVAAAGLAVAVTAPAQAAGPRPHFQMPFPCGETWRLATYYGHDDYDIDMTYTGGASNNRPILASAGGTVSFAGWGSGGGWYVVINHGGGWTTEYLHMISSPFVSTGQGVSIGQHIGNVGSTGNSTGPHLHYVQYRDGVRTESYFNGAPSGITSDGSPNTGPLYIGGPVSAARNVTSANCGQNPRQTWESASHSGWRQLAMGDANGPITGTVTAAIPNSDGSKLFYSVNGGRVFEAASNSGWRNLWTGISGVSNNALAVITVNGVKYIYTVSGGNVYEASSANGWRNLWTGISGASDGALAAIHVNGVKYIYTIVGGKVHEAHSANGWRNLSTNIDASAIAVINANGTKIIYSVANGNVHEAASNNGWRNLWTGISGVNGNALSALHVNGVKYIYSIAGGKVHEAHSANAWRNLNSNVSGSTVSALHVGGHTYLYTA
jgi:hypothetical protein